MFLLLTLQPTFTQGLIIGQLSILLLLGFILKYLFFESTPTHHATPAPLPTQSTVHSRGNSGEFKMRLPPQPESLSESTEWFNLLLREIIQSYRTELLGTNLGPEGIELARLRIEQWANDHRSPAFMDPITIHSISLGCSAPSLSNARIIADKNGEAYCKFDLTYTDSISLSLSTAIYLNVPTPSFARLPVSISLALDVLSAKMTLVPPNRADTSPSIVISLDPDFILDLKTTSLLGSRAKLADVPKVHEMIQGRIRRALVERGTWTIPLPGIGRPATAASSDADFGPP